MTNDELILSLDETRCFCGSLKLKDSEFCKECEEAIKWANEYTLEDKELNKYPYDLNEKEND